MTGRRRLSGPDERRARALRLHQAGDLAGAERLYAALLNRGQPDAELLYLVGVLRFQQARHEEALAVLERAVRCDPTLASAWALSGLAAAALGRPGEALAAYDHALALQPDHRETLANRAVVLTELGRPAEALASADRALALDPALAAAHNNRGNALRDLGRRDEALAAYDAALALRPDLADAHDNRGKILAELARPHEAIASHARALDLAPGHAEARRNLAAALAGIDDPLAALGTFGEPLTRDAELHALAADALARRGRGDAALAAFDRALALRPGDTDLMNRRAVLLAEAGRLGDARRVLADAIAAAPQEPVLYYNYGLFGRFAADSPYLPAMAALDRDGAGLGDEQRTYLAFARAKAASDIGDHGAVMRHLARGNRLVRARIRYDPSETEALYERLRRAFPPGRPPGSEAAGDPTPRPVFIVGMPRSGSTLVEQALSAHSQVHAAGETDAFRAALDAVAGTRGGAYPESVAGLPASDLRGIARRYLDRMPHPGARVARVSDKTLVNLWYLGLIHKVMPRARLIHVVRDPVDTCFSCYSQLFNTPIPFAYDLAELGHYARFAAAMMAHWHAVLPAGTLLDVRYEDVVADPETAIRQVVEHCGLAWEPACVDTHLARRPVRTASVAQVREPISAASVGRWKPYAALLAPLLEALRTPPPERGA